MLCGCLVVENFENFQWENGFTLSDTNPSFFRRLTFQDNPVFVFYFYSSSSHCQFTIERGSRSISSIYIYFGFLLSYQPCYFLNMICLFGRRSVSFIRHVRHCKKFIVHLLVICFPLPALIICSSRFHFRDAILSATSVIFVFSYIQVLLFILASEMQTIEHFDLYLLF